MLRAKSLANCDVTITLNANMEELSPEDSMKGCQKEDIESFVAAVESVRNCGERASKLWSWCRVELTVTVMAFPTITHTSHLGACSYKSRQDFVDNSAYYEDMIGDGMVECQKQLNNEADRINRSGLFEDIFNERYNLVGDK